MLPKSLTNRAAHRCRYGLLDTRDQFAYLAAEDNQLTVLVTREALSTTRSTVPIPQLWHGGNFSCEDGVAGLEDDAKGMGMITCGVGSTLQKWTWEHDPFLAELENSFTSGLVRQFAPRFNSTSRYESVEDSLWPRDCANRDGSFFTRFASNDSDTGTSWFMEVCMPADQRVSPWEDTRARQEFAEELFLNLSTTGGAGSVYHLSLNTTAGYFELPNIMNEGLPGKLLDKDPNAYCDSQCKGQGYRSVGSASLDRVI